jgi:hypothetical protein
MRSFARRAAVVCLLVIGLASQAPARAQQQEIVCTCDNPPGGECRCEPGQVAICKIVNKKCSTACKTYKEDQDDKRFAVLFLQDLFDVRAEELGLSPSGDIINRNSAQESVRAISELLARRRSATLFETSAPEPVRISYLKRAIQQPNVFRVAMPPNVAARLAKTPNAVLGNR